MISWVNGVLQSAEHKATQLYDGAKKDVTDGVAIVKHETTNLIHHVEGAPADAALSPESQEIIHDDHDTSASQVTDPGDRSKIAWNALKTNMGGPANLQDSQGGSTATAWTYGQTMVASLDQAKQTGNYSDFDSLVKGLQKFKKSDGSYAPSTNGVSGRGNSYYDDNSWIGLAFMQAQNQTTNPKQKAQYLGDAESVFKFIKTGQQKDGGLIWAQNESPPTYNTCTEGPAAELALRLHMATYHGDDPKSDPYFQFASQVYNNMQDNLLIKSGPDKGMYADNVQTEGQNGNPPQLSSKIYSYNQGVALGASTLFYQATGEPQYLAQAQETANASMSYLGSPWTPKAPPAGASASEQEAYQQQEKEAETDKPSNLWKQAPAFNAIYMRNLMQLDAVEPDPKYGKFLASYNNQLWDEGLNDKSGLFDRPSSDPRGKYGGNEGEISTLDQAAIVQLYSIQAMTPAEYSDLT